MSESATDLASTLQRRDAVLARVLEGPTDERTLVAALDCSRRTVGRALKELTTLGLVERRIDGVAPTLLARLAVQVYEEFEADVAAIVAQGTDDDSTAVTDADRAALVGLLTDRLAFLEATRTPCDKRTLVANLNCSRSTIDRVLPQLELVGLLQWMPDGYVITAVGRHLADRCHSAFESFDDLLGARDILAVLPADCDLSPALLAGADVERTEETAPYRLLTGIRERLEAADRVRIVLPVLSSPQLLDHCHQRVRRHGMALKLLTDRPLFDTLTTEFSGPLAEMSTDDFVALVGETPPFGLILAESDAATTVSVITYTDGRSAYAAIHNDSERAIAWAETCYERVRNEATLATEDLRRAVSATTASTVVTDSVSLSAVADRSRVEREAEGFVRLTPAYFTRRTPAPPATGWRAGFDLVDVHAGYAIDRETTGSGTRRSLTDDLFERLSEGTDRALLGPPGSGKSTVCQTVACRWYERGNGPVFYRESGTGAHFESPAVLSAHLRDAAVEGHVLVVVEDAVRAEANAIFRVMRAFRGDRTVTFLLDAREQEWQEPTALPTNARLDAYRTEAIETTAMPVLDKREADRFIAHVRATVRSDLGVTVSHLLRGLDLEPIDAMDEDDGKPVRPQAQTGTADRSNQLLLLLHRLAFYADPLVGETTRTPTTLTEDVRVLYEDLEKAGRLALDVGVLVNLLNAAGVGVEPALIYSLAPEESDAADSGVNESDARSHTDRFGPIRDVLELLDGRILFGDGRTTATTTSVPSTHYRAVHEVWSALFLDVMLADGDREGSRQFGRCVTALLALADDADRRERIQADLGSDASMLDRIAATPTEWADETIAQVFGLGLSRPKLAPLLFGTSDSSVLSLPAACSPTTALRCAQWRGEMYFESGHHVPSKRELEHTATLVAEGETPRSSEVVEVSARNDRYRGALAHLGGENETAQAFYEQALASYRAIDDRFGEAKCHNLLGSAAFSRYDLDHARTCYERSLTLQRELGTARSTWTAPLNNLGMVAVLRGDVDQARDYLEQSIEIGRESDDGFGVAFTLINLGGINRLRGDLDSAEDYCKQGLDIVRESGVSGGEARGLLCLSEIARDRGDLDRAEEFTQRSLDLFTEMGSVRKMVQSQLCLGTIALARGDLDDAEIRLTDVLDRCRERDLCYEEGKTLVELGNLARARDLPVCARERFVAGISVFREIGALRDAVEGLERVAMVCVALGDTSAALTHCDTAAKIAHGAEFDDLCTSVAEQRAQIAETAAGGTGDSS